MGVTSNALPSPPNAEATTTNVFAQLDFGKYSLQILAELMDIPTDIRISRRKVP
jgi:hypothetical protein